MYLVSILALMIILPAVSIAAELAMRGGDLAALAAKWFVFYQCGVRQFAAGIVQTTRPQFSTQKIFKTQEPAALAIMREVGFGNLSMGTLGLATLAWPALLVPSAVVGTLFFGLAGIGHSVNAGRNAEETVAMMTDFLICAGLAAAAVHGLR